MHWHQVSTRWGTQSSIVHGSVRWYKVLTNPWKVDIVRVRGSLSTSTGFDEPGRRTWKLYTVIFVLLGADPSTFGIVITAIFVTGGYETCFAKLTHTQNL